MAREEVSGTASRWQEATPRGVETVTERSHDCRVSTDDSRLTGAPTSEVKRDTERRQHLDEVMHVHNLPAGQSRAGRDLSAMRRTGLGARDSAQSATDAMRIEDHDPADASHSGASETSQTGRSRSPPVPRAYMLNVTPRSSHLNEPLGNTRTQTRQSTKL